MTRKRSPLLTVLLLFLIFASSLAMGQGGRVPNMNRSKNHESGTSQSRPKYVPDEILVRFKSGTSRQAMLASHAKVGGTIKREFRSVPGLHLVKLSAASNFKRALRDYQGAPTSCMRSLITSCTPSRSPMTRCFRSNGAYRTPGKVVARQGRISTPRRPGTSLPAAPA